MKITGLQDRTSREFGEQARSRAAQQARKAVSVARTALRGLTDIALVCVDN